MEFKKLFSSRILIPFLLVILLIGIVLHQFFSKPDTSNLENIETPSLAQEEASNEASIKPIVQRFTAKEVFSKEAELDALKENDAAIQQQLDRDREEQKQTKYLKTKLEQTNLKLEQEKALAEINKLKIENAGSFNDSTIEGQKTFPEVKVEYIGGDSVKKEAILSIAGTSFQVKEKSSPTDYIQVLFISDSGVTLHFSAPAALTKTIDYKPE